MLGHFARAADLPVDRNQLLKPGDMNILGQYPQRRMRRLRRDDFSRRLVRETPLDAGRSDLSGVRDRRQRTPTQPVPSMPGVERMTLDRLLPVAEECLKLRIPAMRSVPGHRASL